VARKLAAEAVGTALLLAAVVGSGIMGERLAGGNMCGPRPGRSSVLRACEYIASHSDAALTLERIARHVGCSPFHLQRVFRCSLGVSPKQYARRLRFERFRNHARTGDVTRALHSAGFGSSSRLYENARLQLGMTPSAVARQGEGMTIAYDLVRCPVGLALVAATPAGLCAVKLGGSAKPLESGLRAQFPRAAIRRDARLLRFARVRLLEILAGTARDPALPLDVRATAFQARVWASLRSIPCGTTRTYAAVARAIGRPRGPRRRPRLRLQPRRAGRPLPPRRRLGRRALRLPLGPGAQARASRARTPPGIRPRR